MSNVKVKDFRLIEALLFRYGKFSTSEFTIIVRCSVSKVRKLTSAYAKEYKAINGSQAFTIGTHAHVSTKDSRHFQVVDDFKPITTDLSGELLAEHFDNIIKHYSLFNSISLSETSLGSKTILYSVKPNEDARDDGHYGLMLLLDFLLMHNDSFDPIELAEALSISDIKRTRYLVNIYKNVADMNYNKKASRYEKGKAWTPVVLKPHHNPLSFFESARFYQ